MYKEKFRRHPDLNWGMEVLQTSALPLGYAALSPPALFGWEANPSPQPETLR